MGLIHLFSTVWEAPDLHTSHARSRLKTLDDILWFAPTSTVKTQEVVSQQDSQPQANGNVFEFPDCNIMPQSSRLYLMLQQVSYKLCPDLRRSKSWSS